MYVWGGDRSRSGSRSRSGEGEEESCGQGLSGKDTIRRRSRSPIKKGVLGERLTKLTALSGEVGGEGGLSGGRRDRDGSGSTDDGDRDGGAVIGNLDGAGGFEVGYWGSEEAMDGDGDEGMGKEEGLDGGYKAGGLKDMVSGDSVEKDDDEESILVGRKSFEEKRYRSSNGLDDDHGNGAIIGNSTIEAGQDHETESQKSNVEINGQPQSTIQGKRGSREDSEVSSTSQERLEAMKDSVGDFTEPDSCLSYELGSEDEIKKQEEIKAGGMAGEIKAGERIEEISSVDHASAEAMEADLQSGFHDNDTKEAIQEQTKTGGSAKETRDAGMEDLVPKVDDLLLDTTRETNQSTIATSQERANNQSFRPGAAISSPSAKDNEFTLEDILVVKNGQSSTVFLPLITLKDIMSASRVTQKISSTDGEEEVESEDVDNANERLEILSFSSTAAHRGDRSSSISMQEDTETETENEDANDSLVLSEADAVEAEEIDFIPAESSWMKCVDGEKSDLKESDGVGIPGDGKAVVIDGEVVADKSPPSVLDGSQSPTMETERKSKFKLHKGLWSPKTKLQKRSFLPVAQVHGQGQTHGAVRGRFSSLEIGSGETNMSVGTGVEVKREKGGGFEGEVKMEKETEMERKVGGDEYLVKEVHEMKMELGKEIHETKTDLGKGITEVKEELKEVRKKMEIGEVERCEFVRELRGLKRMVGEVKEGMFGIEDAEDEEVEIGGKMRKSLKKMGLMGLIEEWLEDEQNAEWVAAIIRKPRADKATETDMDLHTNVDMGTEEVFHRGRTMDTVVEEEEEDEKEREEGMGEEGMGEEGAGMKERRRSSIELVKARIDAMAGEEGGGGEQQVGGEIREVKEGRRTSVDMGKGKDGGNEKDKGKSKGKGKQTERRKLVRFSETLERESDDQIFGTEEIKGEESISQGDVDVVKGENDEGSSSGAGISKLKGEGQEMGKEKGKEKERVTEMEVQDVGKKADQRPELNKGQQQENELKKAAKTRESQNHEETEESVPERDREAMDSDLQVARQLRSYIYIIAQELKSLGIMGESVRREMRELDLWRRVRGLEEENRWLKEERGRKKKEEEGGSREREDVGRENEKGGSREREDVGGEKEDVDREKEEGGSREREDVGREREDMGGEKEKKRSREREDVGGEKEDMGGEKEKKKSREREDVGGEKEKGGSREREDVGMEKEKGGSREREDVGMEKEKGGSREREDVGGEKKRIGAEREGIRRKDGKERREGKGEMRRGKGKWKERESSGDNEELIKEEERYELEEEEEEAMEIERENKFERGGKDSSSKERPEKGVSSRNSKDKGKEKATDEWTSESDGGKQSKAGNEDIEDEKKDGSESESSEDEMEKEAAIVEEKEKDKAKNDESGGSRGREMSSERRGRDDSRVRYWESQQSGARGVGFWHWIESAILWRQD
ncbi:hypothetical protein ACMFMF_007507 [Clarireedia jacksonii]